MEAAYKKRIFEDRSGDMADDEEAGDRDRSGHLRNAQMEFRSAPWLDQGGGGSLFVDSARHKGNGTQYVWL